MSDEKKTLEVRDKAIWGVAAMVTMPDQSEVVVVAPDEDVLESAVLMLRNRPDRSKNKNVRITRA